MAIVFEKKMCRVSNEGEGVMVSLDGIAASSLFLNIASETFSFLAEGKNSCSKFSSKFMAINFAKTGSSTD